MESYRGEPLRHMGELPSMLASRYGDRDALIGPEQTQSFAELEARANSVANVLVECGVAPGDRVGMYVPNTLQFPESYFGIIKTGAIPVPLNLRLDKGTLEYVLNDSEATYLVVSDRLGITGATLTAGELADRADVGVTLLPGGEGDDQLDYDTAVDAASPEFETIDRAYDDVCLQLYTSGTTGKPKGVHSTHQNLLASNESFARSALPLDPSDSALCVMPLFHIFGI